MTSNGVPTNQPPDPVLAAMDGFPLDPFPAPDPARFPNTRRRISTPRNPPDTYADPDTCRICRGEGGADEPLFYPCKCSGSIKYVHQDCLMEWLSHSQKKHCELCKTPFRFTKLYDPNMPKALPTLVLASHTARYLLRNLLVWMRAGLVATVWLGCLPYLMRAVWSFLFWISDEGLGGRSAAVARGLDMLAGAPFGSSVCPASPLFAATTTVATPESARLVKGLYGMNLTAGDPIYSAIMRLLFGAASEAPAGNATARLPEHHQSLLSGVGFLRNLTRFSSVNRIAIDTLEGQIITILVIVCFILIILVRDYVVQQQPEINMRAAFAENPHAPVEPEAVPENPFDEADELDELGELDEPEDASEAASEPAVEPFPAHADRTDPPRLLPSFPSLADNARAVDFDRATVHEYLDIYREAGGDPDKILRIAQERNLEGRLEYWMRLTRAMMDRRQDDEAGPSHATTEGGFSMDHQPLDGPSSAKGKDKAVEGMEDMEDMDNEIGIRDIKGLDGFDSIDGTGSDGIDIEQAIEEAVNFPIGGRLRPRANTDGPQINNTMNPLANNNWSFSDVPLDREPDLPLREPDFSLDREPDFPLDREPDFPAWNTPESSGTRPSSADTQLGNALALAIADPTETHVPQPPRRDARLPDRVANFMWREVDTLEEAELAPVTRLGDFGEDEPDDDAPGNPLPPGNPNRDAADAAGLDAEAIEDAEDLEGILELLGMRGPVAGLLQNAIFCAFLVSITIFLGVFIPYNIGRVTIWGLANPMRIARMLFGFSKFVQDCALLALGLAASTISESVYMLSRALMLTSAADYALGAANASWATAVGAAGRIGGSFVTELPLISATEVRNFSAVSHEALFTLKGVVADGFSALWQLLGFLLGGDYAVKASQALSVASTFAAVVWHTLAGLPTALVNPSSWVLDLDLPETAGTVSAELAYWGGADRFWAVLTGYLAVSLMAGLYLRRGTPFSTSQAAQDWEASVIDGLNQASGVMKVILIISIEMLVFPLYCGMLLDVALLPLFEDATLKSRLLFTLQYPVTSVFVHWFIGTGYMFHFALFVSMCRKIMRKGVLYFIRDPDDPEFHPVRDVLERSVTTQLRKILFSAFVYGALVMMCLGGVVWGLYLALSNVLPIHYTSNEPVLEFPIDLLFYNFVMPSAVRFFKPNHALHAMYTWWFRRSARALRITWFLFGDWRVDEEGRLALRADSPDRRLPFWRQWFLEVDGDGQVVARSWRGILEGGTADQPDMEKAGHDFLYNVTKTSLVRSGQLVPDGRFVRTPASDQVKIPKGTPVFFDVNEDNTRIDGAPDEPQTDMYASKQYQLVYVPPHFRFRVFLFILSIWLFAAATGVGLTIVPLVFGRWMFRQLIPGHIRTNDVYAFSIGVHVLGVAAYALFHVQSIYEAAGQQLAAAAASVSRREGLRRALDGVAHVARVVYAYSVVFVVFPLLVASLMELYALIPLHEMMYSAVLKRDAPAANPAHTVRVVQAWTIGLLYLKLAMRITNTWFRGSRVSNAARAVLRRGWLDPDVSILTRSFVVPGLAVWLAAVATPLVLARVGIADGLAETAMQKLAKADGAPDQTLYDACVVLIYRMSFPLMALAVVSALTLWSVVGVFRSWQVRIRDEAYLIGERLHNFGGTNAPRPRGGWRAGGARI
jgi:E3 ubiquitin-protein ligase MARCH6